MTSQQVMTASGNVAGVSSEGTWAFKGVPYGDDTSGAGRFRPPRPPRPWRGVRDCSEYGPSCPQMTQEQLLSVPMPPEVEAFMGTRNQEREMGEDCLVLNVWTPSVDPSAGLPVLVWLHGGAWSTGSASWPLYDFSNLARRGNAVVVGLNHRVGILGFLDLSTIDDDFAESGNVGMLDVVAALEWIRENVAGFGGDPGNVTVFGESGGGAKVATLLAMPAGQGLFHKAFAMSGSLLLAQEPHVAASNTQAVLGMLGGDSVIRKIEAVSVSRLVDAEVGLPGRNVFDRGHAFSPVLGPSLPKHPADAIRTGLSRDVTLVSGCTSDEMLAFLFHDADLWTLGFEDVLDRLGPSLGDDAARVLGRYRSAHPQDSPTDLLISIATDRVFRVPQIRLAEAMVEGGGDDTYMYMYEWGFPDPTGRVRALHGTDMPYFFDNVDKAPMADGPHAQTLTAAMSAALVALAHTNSPAHGGLPDWPQYTLSERPTMCIDLESRVRLDPLGDARRCWDGMELPGLGGE